MLAMEITTALIQSQGIICKPDIIAAVVLMGADPIHRFN